MDTRTLPSRHNHCKLSEGTLVWLNGELLGDAWMRSMSKHSAKVGYTSKYPEYILYVADTLSKLGVKNTDKIYRQLSGYGAVTFHFETRAYVELLPVWRMWYPNGKKVVPKTIKLTPLTCRQWYIGDGSIVRNSYIALHTQSFSKEDVKWLVAQLREIGFWTTRMPSNNTIMISSCSAEDFLTYIGGCPVECYEYKWRLLRKEMSEDEYGRYKLQAH